jgi:hypothetical protein
MRFIEPYGFLHNLGRQRCEVNDQCSRPSLRGRKATFRRTRCRVDKRQNRRQNMGMTLRLPRSLPGQSSRDALDIMAAEIRVEKAAALERAGEAAGKAVAALHAIAPADPQRPVLVADAAEAVWGYFIQRELLGQVTHNGVIRDLAIPREVLLRLGAKPREP